VESGIDIAKDDQAPAATTPHLGERSRSWPRLPDAAHRADTGAGDVQENVEVVRATTKLGALSRAQLVARALGDGSPLIT
jgi:hypothetical protein